VAALRRKRGDVTLIFDGMARYQAILAYDGTDYAGFQRQTSKSKKLTVQGELEAALRKLGWKGAVILSAGRTDAGTHASGQVAAFDLDWTHPVERLQSALNAYLPKAMAIKALHQVGSDFHPRYDAQSRRYRYRIYLQPVRDPLRERYAWRVWPDVDLEQMQRAADCLIGEHDFRAFGTAPRAGGATVRCVIQADWEKHASDLIFNIQADAFLYRMVRRLVSFQVEIGQGKLKVEALQERLRDLSPEKVKTLAPARGLTLVEVNYLT
jgi:tRNA pseudouridine38-40 synthase